MKLKPRELGFIVLVVIVSILCIRLGIWQLSRYRERQSLNDRILGNLASEPLSGTEWLNNPGNYEYFRVIVRGVFDPEYEILMKNRSRDGVSGYHLVTPLQLQESDTAILVDRGWIPLDPGSGLARYEIPGTVEITGIVRKSQAEPSLPFLKDTIPSSENPPLKEWRVLNIEGIQGQTPYPVAPVYIAQESPPENPPPFPEAEIELSSGPHLGYAMQWFAFAGIALIGGILWLRWKARADLNPR